MENFSKKEQEWLEKILGKVAAEADHLANEDPDKFLNQISLGSKNENKKNKELKVARTSEELNLQTDGNELKKSTLQKLIDRFNRK